jgi:hypothetical protein
MVRVRPGSSVRSVDAFEVAWLPGAVEGCLLGSVDTEVHKPANVRNGADPAVPLIPGSRGGPDVEVEVAVGDVEVVQRAEHGLALVGVDLAAGARVIDRDRPAQPGRSRERNSQAVGAGTVEVVSGAVAQTEPLERPGVLVARNIAGEQPMAWKSHFSRSSMSTAGSTSM